MRLIATLLLTVLCFGLSAAEFSAGDLTAIADKAKTMKVGESASVKVMIDGKPVYVGLVMGASGVTVAGEGVPAGTYKFLYSDQGLAVQSTQAGQPTKTVLVKGDKVATANRDVSAAFGAGAVSTFAYQKERDAAFTEYVKEVRAAGSGQQRYEAALKYTAKVRDLNSIRSMLLNVYVSSFIVPRNVVRLITQNDATQQAIISNNASNAQPN